MSDLQNKLVENILKASEYINKSTYKPTGNYIVASKTVSDSFTKLFDDGKIIEKRKRMMEDILNKIRNKND